MIITASFKYRWITLDVSAEIVDGVYEMPKIYFEHEAREVSDRLFDKAFSEAMDALNEERCNFMERRGHMYDFYV